MGNQVKILIVDDSPSVRDILGEFLQERYQVSAASDGKEAIAAYHDFAPDIILLDMNMPHMGGLEVIEHLRGTVADQNVYLLVVTADTSFTLKKKALERGANDYLIKPYKPEELLARVGVAERQVRLSRQLRRAFESIDTEIEMLADIQARLLPRKERILDGVRIRSLFLPSGRASGDFFDYFQVKGGVLRVSVADVSGHGARAAFLMGVVHTLLRTTETSFLDIGQTLKLMNSFLCSIIRDEPDYVSLFVADIDVGAGRMEYANAGHCPALLKRPDNTVDSLEQTTHVLGFFDLEQATRTAPFENGSCLLLYTDGMYEWTTGAGDIFGLDRFMDRVASVMTGQGPCLQQVMDELVAMSGQATLRDDATALLVQVDADQEGRAAEDDQGGTRA
ncbi:MAG: PP2C family protein-serine/threonine phosphatase [Desulfohalobiaceae bacterium]